MKFLFMIILLFPILSCDNGAKQHTQDENEKILQVVKPFLDEMFSEGDFDYIIDSIEIEDITDVKRLEADAFRFRDSALKYYKDAEEKANDPFNGTKEEFERLRAKAILFSEMSRDSARKSLNADSMKTIYYSVKVIARVTYLKKESRRAVFPFLISTDYELIKDPLQVKGVKK